MLNLYAYTLVEQPIVWHQLSNPAPPDVIYDAMIYGIGTVDPYDLPAAGGTPLPTSRIDAYFTRDYNLIVHNGRMAGGEGRISSCEAGPRRIREVSPHKPWRAIVIGYPAGGIRGMGGAIDGNYWVITLILQNMVIYPSVWRIMHNSCYPWFLQHFLYTYPLINILYLGEPSGNIICNHHVTYPCRDILLYFPSKESYQIVFFCQGYCFIYRWFFFFGYVTSKTLSFFTDWKFSQVDIIIVSIM